MRLRREPPNGLDDPAYLALYVLTLMLRVSAFYLAYGPTRFDEDNSVLYMGSEIAELRVLYFTV